MPKILVSRVILIQLFIKMTTLQLGLVVTFFLICEMSS